MIDARDALGVLLRLTRQLTETTSLEVALRHVTDAAILLVPADHASVRILDDARTDLLSGARSGAAADSRPLAFRVGQGIAGLVAEKGHLIRLDDVELDPRFARPPGASSIPMRSILCVPMFSMGVTVGVLSCSAATVGAFRPEDETIMLLLANCAVPPIERARLVRLASTDALTHSWNRRYLDARLEHELARARRSGAALSFLAVDLDRFKRINDTYGHAAGDDVLRDAAERMRGAIRRSDVLVRSGGEEFVVLMPDTDRDTVGVVAERVRAAVGGTPFDLGPAGRETITLSVGTATWDRAEDGAALAARADAALYEAKRAGRDRVVASS